MKDYAKYCLKNGGSKTACGQSGKINLNLIVLLVLVVGVVVYLAQSNSIVSAGFKLRESQKAVKEKEQAFEELQVQATRLKSLPVLESALRNRQMVEAGNVSYIVLERDAFAANR